MHVDKIPIALARFKLPLTRPACIKPPAFKILSFSTSRSGLWSLDRLYAWKREATGPSERERERIRSHNKNQELKFWIENFFHFTYFFLGSAPVFSILSLSNNFDIIFVYLLEFKLEDVFKHPWLMIMFFNNQQQTCWRTPVNYKITWPFLDITQRESPAFATISW